MHRPKHRPILVAHRGFHRTSHIENTLPAFQAALELGIDMIECDIRLGSDNHLFCCHDKLLRGTNVEEISAEQREDHGLPLLEDVLLLMEDYPEQGIVIEAKTREAGAALLGRVKPSEKRFTISFSDYHIYHAQQAGWQAGYLQAGGPELARDLAGGDYLLGPSAQMAPAYTDEELARSNVWTVNDLALAELLHQRGVWALTTNYPDILLDYFEG